MIPFPPFVNAPVIPLKEVGADQTNPTFSESDACKVILEGALYIVHSPPPRVL